jgi:modulator of FtsH protease
MQVWESFFVTAGGAAAVLAGLIFVGISINLQKLLERTIVSRGAWVSLLTLMEVLLISLFVLIPEQSQVVLGIEMGGIGLICWVIICIVIFYQFAHSHRDGFLEGQTWQGRLAMILLSQLITVPFIIGGILLFLNNASGIYWALPGILSALPYSLYMGWVLTVEVNR